MRRLLLAALAAAALINPAGTLAADSPGRYFEIHALVLGGQRMDAKGTLRILNGQLSASAGCNSIGAPVAVQGDTIKITGPAFMTEMACPGQIGDAEAMLIKILELGVFTISDDAWTAAGGRIVTVEVPAPDPGPAVPPDQPIGNDPNATCPTLIFPNTGGASGAGTTGSGTIEPGVVEPDPGGGAPDDQTCVDLGPGANPGEAGGIDIGKGAVTTPGAEPTLALRDDARDVLFVPLAIGLALLVLVTAGIYLKTRPARATPREDS
jgi:hypothetical protein